MKRSDWLDSNVPEGKWESSLDLIPSTPPSVAAYKLKAQTYIGAMKENIERGRGLLLYGPYRSGKSCLAALACKEVLAHRCNAYWLEAFELVDGWRFKDDRYASFRDSHLFVLDDLGTEASSNIDWPRAIVREALRFRLERLRPVVITTNMNPDELRKVYGDKLIALLDDYMLTALVGGVDWKAQRR